MLARPLHKSILGGFVLVVFLTPLAMLLLPGHLAGTTDEMVLLPAYNKFKCILCHTSATPGVGAADLNVFGIDFRDNGSVWDRTLALLNSDNDKCLNGFELGDKDGDGVFDFTGEVLEHSNPGDSADCSIALTVQTWGKIKEVFRSEIRDFVDEDDLQGDSWSLHFP